MKIKIRQQLANRKGQILRRLDKSKLGDCSKPVLTARNIDYEFSERIHGLAYGGIGAMVQLARKIGLIDQIDKRLHLLKIHLPYHSSDHVMNFAINALCNGDCLQDIELRRNDAVFLDALGARRIPDPTTAGDCCRRFDVHHINLLQDIFDDIRIGVWQQQPAAFKKVLLRGDTDFSQTQHLDRWDDEGRIRFIFGYDSKLNLQDSAAQLPERAWHKLERPPRYEPVTGSRQRPDNVKDRIVHARGYETKRLQGEAVAEFNYQPTACAREYRMVVVRKDILHTKGDQVLFSEFRYSTSFTSPMIGSARPRKSLSAPTTAAIRKT